MKEGLLKLEKNLKGTELQNNRIIEIKSEYL